MSASVTKLQTRKNAPGETRLVTDEEAPPAPGDVRLAIDRFALTANNITYAAFGDAMNYWAFFPSGDQEWGHMPVWGFADVVASEVDGVEPGERFYGYFPAATHVTMTPVRVTQRGFYDGASHRQDLVSAYNQYTRCSADPAWNAAHEDYQMLLRPLFITSFMLADYLYDNAFFGADQIVFSSASAKTCYGTAWCLPQDMERIALTSPANLPFTRDLGVYRGSHAYDALDEIDPGRPTLYVDFSGDAALRGRVHRHFGAALVHDCFAGSARNNSFLEEAELPGPKPRFYFAPNQIRKRNADWGAAELTHRINEAQARFVQDLSARGLLEIERAMGLTAAQDVIADFSAGRSDPRKGHIVRLA